MKFTILALQEYYWSKHTKELLTHHSWTLIQSSTPTKGQPRSAIYVNNNALPASNFEPVNLLLNDVTAIKIKTEDDKPTLIINVYKPCNHNLITLLQQYLSTSVNAEDYGAIVILGDFNLHHSLWNPQNYTNHDAQAEELIETMADLGMELMLPAGTVTFPRASTTIDLVWGNNRAIEAATKCKVSTRNDHTSDHLAIETMLNLKTPNVEQTQKPFNYDKTDWKSMEYILANIMPPIINPDTATSEEVDTFASDISKALHQATSETTPRKQPTPYSKRWWNDDLTKQRQQANKARNRFRRTRSDDDLKVWKKKKKTFHKSINKAKQKTWRDFVNNADEKSIWQVKKYLNSTPSQPYIPTLDKAAASNDTKAQKFQATFFPPPPPADTTDISANTIYPESVPCNTNITMQQVTEAIEKLAPNKAPGPDEISNCVLKKMFPIIKHHLKILAQASLNNGHFPAAFKSTTTIVLRKPGKPDYTKPNAYRPIALENTIGKVLESIIAEVLSYLIETYDLLPQQYYSGRPGRTIEDAMMLLTERIHEAWKRKDIFSAVFMDVAGAFNNIYHERLLDNMQKRRVLKQIIKWIGSFLQARTTQLRFNDFTSTSIAIPAGILQGSLLSPLLYMFYNSDLLDILASPHLSLRFINDIAYSI
jgi:hypothetical protein